MNTFGILKYHRQLKALESMQKDVLAFIRDNPEVKYFRNDVYARKKNRRLSRVWPIIDLPIEQIEGMFTYNMPMDYETPFGVLNITPDQRDVIIDMPGLNRRLKD